MSKKLLIDGIYPEETRVALIDEKNRLLEYDFSSIAKETVKGNIYLAKVMRVEPSLQAAFVEYGGNRHGFLAFSEIHPDYFRIPVSDREALAAQLYEQAYPLDEDEPEDGEASEDDESAETSAEGDAGEETVDFENSVSTISGESIEHVDHDDDERVHAKRPQLHRMYKIQEVVHKNQILLVQVVKEERGQKGAALTTYLSLAGRYCVLMPNSPHAGGISRKIATSTDRKRLRSVLEGLEIPREMGLIIRTAGKDRTKVEIKRDTDYLMRQWEEIREETLKSIAPALIYQEDTIIRRAIRDLYTKDVKEVIVDGVESFKTAKDFMKRLMPSHAKDVIQHKDPVVPLFTSYRIEKQLDMMHSAVVPLPSGGSIVLHPTEALVSIDINSGKATRERHITDTALNTNLEAAVEAARQIRMRDLAGLIVIDFIDMEDRRHVQQVERKVREAFRDDRARVQMSKISPFGLLELSRQRLRPSILETSSAPCAHCQSTGYVRSTESMGLQILRTLEEEGFAGRTSALKLQVPFNVAWYLLNQKRRELSSLEDRHQMSVEVQADDTLIVPDYRIIQLERKNGQTPSIASVESQGEEGGVSSQKRMRESQSRNKGRNDVSAANDDSTSQSEESGEQQNRRNNNRNKKGRNKNQNRADRPETRETLDQEGGAAPREATEGDSPAGEAQDANGRKRKRNRRRGRNRGDRPQRTDGNPTGQSGDEAAPAIELVRAEAIEVSSSDESVVEKASPKGRGKGSSAGSSNKKAAEKASGKTSVRKKAGASENTGEENTSKSQDVSKDKSLADKSSVPAPKDKDLPKDAQGENIVPMDASAESSKETASAKRARKPKSWLKRLLE